MRTTMDIPEDLLMDAMKVSRSTTKTMTVVLGLKELLHRHQIDALRALKGKVGFEADLSSSRKR